MNTQAHMKEVCTEIHGKVVAKERHVQELKVARGEELHWRGVITVASVAKHDLLPDDRHVSLHGKKRDIEWSAEMLL